MFVLPSDREGLPNSLLEAMACGLACVAPASAAGDQVLDPSSGVVPPSNDPRDLADALAALEHDPEHRARLGAGARTAAQHYGLDAVTDRYESCTAPTLTSPPQRTLSGPRPRRERSEKRRARHNGRSQAPNSELGTEVIPEAQE